MKYAQGLRQGVTEAIVAAMVREAGVQVQMIENGINQQVAEAEKAAAAKDEEVSRLKERIRELEKLVPAPEKPADKPSRKAANGEAPHQ